jgi:hypothetical protein
VEQWLKFSIEDGIALINAAVFDRRWPCALKSAYKRGNASAACPTASRLMEARKLIRIN